MYINNNITNIFIAYNIAKPSNVSNKKR